MTTNYTPNGFYPYKGLFLLAGLLLVSPLLVYQLTIRETLQLKRATRTAESEILRCQEKEQHTLPEASLALRQPEELLSGRLLQALQASGIDTTCVVLKYTPYLTEERDGIRVSTAELVVTGRYIPLVRLIAWLENHPTASRLVSVHFQKVLLRQNRQVHPQLQLTVILQQLVETITQQI